MISILLAVYNGEKFLEKSINSILVQTHGEFELLIGFNGTTDSSKEIVSKFNDKRIRVFDYFNDKGKSKTLNKLLLESKFDWICIQDDDDVWVDNKLSEQIKYINEFDVIGTQIMYSDTQDNLRNGPFLKMDDMSIKILSLNGNNQIANSSAMIRKDSIIEVGDWDEELEGIEDYDMWIRLIKKIS